MDNGHTRIMAMTACRGDTIVISDANGHRVEVYVTSP